MGKLQLDAVLRFSILATILLTGLLGTAVNQVGGYSVRDQGVFPRFELVYRTIRPTGQVIVSQLPVGGIGSTDTTFRVPDVAAYEAEKLRVGQRDYRPPEKNVFVDPASTGLMPLAVSTTSGFQGIDQITGCNCLPPDTVVAVGPSHVFEMVNIKGRIYTKTGTIVQTVDLNAFFLAGGHSLTDPKILYDSINARWFASIADRSDNTVRVGASTTNDPTGLWTIYTIASFSSSQFPDQPLLGVSDDKVVISSNNFVGISYVGFQLYILNKSNMLSGSSVGVASTSPDTGTCSVHPVHSMSSTTTHFAVSVGCASGQNFVRIFSITGVPGVSTVSISFVDRTVTSVNVPPNAPQLGSSTLLQTNDHRVLSTVWFLASLWFTLNDGCLPAGDVQTRSCLRFVNVNTASVTIAQDFDFVASGSYYAYPSLTLDSSGNLLVGFQYSSGSSYPGAKATGRAVSDPANTLQASQEIKTGSGFLYGTNPVRWGDYSGTALDPSDTTLAWVAQEFGVSGQAWSTWIASVRVTSPFNAPSNLFATSVSTSQIDLSWVDNSADESDFHIERDDGCVNSWGEIATVGAGATSFQNSGLGTGMMFCYRVRAHRHSDDVYTNYSNVASATTAASNDRAATSLALSATPNPVIADSLVTLTTTMSGMWHELSGKVSGKLVFISGWTSSGTCTTGGTGICQLTFLAPSNPGQYQVTAMFSGDANFGPSSTSIQLAVNPSGIRIVATITVNSYPGLFRLRVANLNNIAVCITSKTINLGQTDSLTCVVNASTYKVEVYRYTTKIYGPVTVTVPPDYIFSLNYGAKPRGPFQPFADPILTNVPSPDEGLQPITHLPASTTLSLSASPNPVPAGNPVTFTITLSGTWHELSGVVSGKTVVISGGGSGSCVTSSGGTCQVVSNAPPSPGQYQVDVNFAGEANFDSSSSSLTLNVNPAGIMISVTITVNSYPGTFRLRVANLNNIAVCIASKDIAAGQTDTVTCTVQAGTYRVEVYRYITKIYGPVTVTVPPNFQFSMNYLNKPAGPIAPYIALSVGAFMTDGSFTNKIRSVQVKTLSFGNTSMPLAPI